MQFDNRTYLVTGSAGGIGLRIAQEFLANGAVVFLSRRPGGEPPALAELGPNARDVELDVTSEADWERVVDGIVADRGALSGLINNAAYLAPGIQFTELTLAEWRRHLDVNLDGVFMGCRAAMRAMTATGGGSIVNISSGAAHIVVPDAAAYCVSKSAVLTLTRLAAKAGGRHGVRVNAILPGAIDTPMLWRNLGDGQSPDDLLDALTRLHPIGRIGTTQDVARAVLFLCDPANSFITGAMLAVDGGQLVN
jgi:NAD(P)-dependent dehydrogenase (short-subunit alcohol dehydrogenase family)